MTLTHRDLRQRIQTFWEERNHAEVPPIPLVPQNDPTTLFTGSGMQQMVPYLLGEVHPLGNRLYNIQPCLRSQDIEEVGDNRHTTMFEMIGNWSLGDYFKKEQLPYFFEFLTNKEKGLGLDPQHIYVTTFKGADGLPADEESISIWKDIFAKVGIKAELGERIFQYPADKNWWSRAGVPSNMPAGEPGGPDSETFYDFGADLKLHENSQWKDEECHPNCDCGRFMEIGNSVFMQYKKKDDGTFEPLPAPNVDFGGGMERQLAAVNDDPDVFKTDLYEKIIATIEKHSRKSYEEHKMAMRIIADHLKAAAFLIKDGVRPSNKEQGYMLRRLMRRAIIKMRNLSNNNISPDAIAAIVDSVIDTYEGVYFDRALHGEMTQQIVKEEVVRFSKTLEEGLKKVQKMDHIDGKIAFDLYQSYGFPLEIVEELVKEKGQAVNRDEFQTEFNKHKELSRSASAGKFKGGLADQSEQTLKYHTATHLLHQALFDVLGDQVRQEGSNITGERLRFDFAAGHKPTEEEVKKVETIINEKINAGLPMRYKNMPKTDAEKVGAKSFFKEKYPDMVKVYYIGGEDDKPETAYSKEFCGGPHVTNTKEIGNLEIYKVEKIGSNLFRIYAK